MPSHDFLIEAAKALAGIGIALEIANALTLIAHAIRDGRRMPPELEAGFFSADELQAQQIGRNRSVFQRGMRHALALFLFGLAILAFAATLWIR